jgi:hypothetical protein
MSIQNLLARYSLDARAQGENEDTIRHTSRIVGIFDDFRKRRRDKNLMEASDESRAK